MILYLREVKRSLNATTGMLPLIQHRPFPLVPIDMELEYSALGVHSHPVVRVTKDRQDVLMQARGVCKQGEELLFLLVGKSVETICDVWAVGVEINFATLPPRH